MKKRFFQKVLVGVLIAGLNLTSLDPGLSLAGEATVQAGSDQGGLTVSVNNNEGDQLSQVKLQKDKKGLAFKPDFSVAPTYTSGRMGILRGLIERVVGRIFASNDELERVGEERKFNLKQESGELIYTKTERGVKEEIVLEKAPQENAFAFALDLGDLVIRRRPDGLWYFYDKIDTSLLTPRFYIPPPFMTDARGERSENVSISHVIEGNGEYLVVEPDREWLEDPSRVYPVIIDPSFELPPEDKEVVEKRTLTSKTRQNEDGSFTWSGSIGPIHYLDDSGNLKEIDTTFKRAADPAYAYEVTSNNSKVYFKETLSGDFYLKYQVGEATLYQGIEKIQEGLGEVDETAKAIVKDNTLTYHSIFPGIDLRYTLTPDKLLEEFIVRERGLAQKITSLIQTLKIEGAHFRVQGDGSIKSYDSYTGDEVFSFPKPVMYELKTQNSKLKTQNLEIDDQNLKNYGLHYEVNCGKKEVEPCKQMVVTKVLDQKGKGWLRDPERSYPVAVDATLNLQVGASGDDAEQKGSPQRVEITSGDLDMHSTDSYGAVRFTSVTIPQGAIIDSATMQVVVGGQTKTKNDPDHDIYGDDEDNAATFTACDPCTTISDRPTTSASVQWTATDLTMGSWATSPELKTVVQEIVDRQGWSSGNALVLIFYPRTNPNFDIRTYDDATTKGAKLDITYTEIVEGGVSGCKAPASGSPNTNWTVNSTCDIYNEDNTVYGNLTVTSTGVLNLRGESAVKFSGVNRYIYVKSGGGTINIYDEAGIGVPGDTGTGGTGSWSTTTALPKRMREHEAQAYKGYMYLLGGVDNTGTTLNSVYYAPINSNGTLGSWTSTNTFTGVRRCHGSALYNGYIYVLGGYNGSSYLNSVYYAPINSNGTVGTWSSTTSLTRAKCVIEATVAYQGYVYAVGGFYGSPTSEVHYAPINSNGTLGSWTATTSLPEARTYRVSAYRGYLYAVENTTSSANYYYAPINSNGSIGSWSTGTSPSQSRQQIANLITPGGYYYRLGGNTSSAVKADVEYNVIGEDGTPGGSWTSSTALPAVRRWGQAVYSRSYLYYLGGTDNTTGSFGYERDTVYYTQLTGDSPP